MRHFLGVLVASLAVAVIHVGCSGANQNAVTTPGGDDAGPDANNPTQPPDPPHALGTILLGESHSSQGGTSTPVVEASFMPDASQMPPLCTKSVGSCQMAETPTCTGGCPVGSICSFNARCGASCVKEPVCNPSCGPDEVCVALGTGPATCQKAQSFDAGALAFAGTTTPITLFPPYAYSGPTGGAPFLAGAQIEVQGAGAAGPGFDAFDEKFTATTFLQSQPALATIPLTAVFGKQDLPIGWLPGSDSVTITVSGAGGTATCAADDTTGTYTVPRAVLTAAMGSTSNVTITLTRQKTDVRKTEKTHGTLPGETVQPLGFLDLTTSSVESTSFQGCSVGLLCGTSCVDTTSDNSNCGGCGIVCPSSTSCSNSQCVNQCTASAPTYCTATGQCVNTTNDSNNCGSCGHVCQGGTFCSASQCSNTCGSLTYCSATGQCVNTTNDNNNCGFCGNVCPSGTECSSSQCINPCATDTSFPTFCNATGTCVNTTNDVNNCGFCGNVCPGGDTCQSSQCIAPPVCSTCISNADNGTCLTQLDNCINDTTTGCPTYRNCVDACALGDTTCIANCGVQNSLFASLESCVCSTAACSSQGCTTQCADGQGF